MAANRSGRRVSYDRLWGALLLFTCLLPVRVGTEEYSFFGLLGHAGGAPVVFWLLLGTVTGLFGLVAGFAGLRSRWRHFLNFLLGSATLALPLAAPVIWERFPSANPASLPLSDLGGVGWVMLVALTAIYAGSGIRVVRPSQIFGQLLAGLGALLLAVFAFLPVGRADVSAYAPERMLLLASWTVHWTENAVFLLVCIATVFAIVNLVRSSGEVQLAKLARLFLVVALLFPVLLPFLQSGGGGNPRYVTTAWGALRLFGPLFLAIDGCIAFLAISITRSND
jgi:hypothetical protein